ncbi:MAG: hypothetical protein V3T01_05085 [Myxococcota bacterium]
MRNFGPLLLLLLLCWLPAAAFGASGATRPNPADSLNTGHELVEESSDRGNERREARTRWIDVGLGWGRALTRYVRSAVGSIFRFGPAVDFIRLDPDPRLKVYQHYNPILSVSGIATTLGANGRYDIILVIDVSASTSEFAQTDVSGDGKLDDTWRGSDSILKAQAKAARGFVEVLKRLPNNRAGKRIRVGVVAFAGDEDFYLSPDDRNLDATPTTIFALALRDAEVVSPLTSDYEAVDRELAKLSQVRPVGTTNFAAGIGRAILELAPEPGVWFAPETADPTRKVIQFLTDGKPRLPYDRHKAARVALRAAKLAKARGIRINSFALGRNAVTRKVNGSVKKIAQRTDGNFVELENPGDIVSILNASSFGFVDQVRLINQTTDRATPFATAGIDGSFYGEIPLEPGMNKIKMVAKLHDRREISQTFTIEYRDAPPVSELLAQLERIRRENEALVNRIKDRLASEMNQAQKNLEVRVEK